MDVSTASLAYRQRLHSLTGARFVAAAMVFVFHVSTLHVFSPAAGIGGPLTTLTKSAATVGVSFFFLLSGFVLTWSARPGDTYRGFLRRRLVKIYPSHLIAFSLAMLAFAAASTPPSTAVLNVLLLHAWVPNPAVFLGVDGPSWSLSCELFFYALFPLLLSLVNRVPARRLWWCAGGVVAVVVLLPTVALLLPAQPTFPTAFAGTVLDHQPVYRLWFLYAFPPARLLEFVLGMLMARIVLSGQWISLRRTTALLLAAAGYVVAVCVPMVYTVAAVTVVPLALLIPAMAVGEEQGRGRALTSPLLRRLGEASFAFYLLHEIVLIFLRAVVGFDRQLGVSSGLIFVTVAFGLSIALALLLHRFVEAPAVYRWGRFRPDGAGRRPVSRQAVSRRAMGQPGSPGGPGAAASTHGDAATQAPQSL